MPHAKNVGYNHLFLKSISYRLAAVSFPFAFQLCTKHQGLGPAGSGGSGTQRLALPPVFTGLEACVINGPIAAQSLSASAILTYCLWHFLNALRPQNWTLHWSQRGMHVGVRYMPTLKLLVLHWRRQMSRDTQRQYNTVQHHLTNIMNSKHLENAKTRANASI